MGKSKTKRKYLKDEKFVDCGDYIKIKTSISNKNGFALYTADSKHVGSIHFSSEDCMVDNDPGLIEFLKSYWIYSEIERGKRRYVIARDKKTCKDQKIHRLIWQYYYGELSPYKRTKNGLVVDHLDDNKMNNRIENLCLMTLSQNSTKSRIMQQSIPHNNIYLRRNPNIFNEFILAFHCYHIHEHQIIYLRYSDLEIALADLNQFKAWNDNKILERFNLTRQKIIGDKNYTEMKVADIETSDLEKKMICDAMRLTGNFPRIKKEISFNVFNKKITNR